MLWAVRLAPSPRLRLIFLLWLLGEVLAFAAVAAALGVPGALLAALITSLFGWTLLKRSGQSAVMKLRTMMENRAAPSAARPFAEDALSAAAALALVLPGFLSDVIGAALLLPPVRRRLAASVGRWLPTLDDGARPRGAPTIDLGPEDWRRNEAAPDADPKRLREF